MMTDKLKPCPFCGVQPDELIDTFANPYIVCFTDGCPVSNRPVRPMRWQFRPIEDTLNTRITDLSRVGRRMMADELKSCPFCGSDYIEVAYDVNEQYWCCENCGASNGTSRDEFGWNSRPLEDALIARIAELKEYIKQLIETGDAMSNAYPNWMREEDDWEALVKKVERELGEVKA